MNTIVTQADQGPDWANKRHMHLSNLIPAQYLRCVLGLNYRHDLERHQVSPKIVAMLHAFDLQGLR